MITGDGVTLKYSANYASQSVSANDIVSAKVTPAQVKYQNGVSDSYNNINIEKGSVSGHIVSLAAKINEPIIIIYLQALLFYGGDFVLK